MSGDLTVRPAVRTDDVEGWIRGSWGDTVMAVHGELYDVIALPALVAATGGRLLGVLTYALGQDELEIVSCDADPPGRGTGRSLVSAVVGVAREHGARSVWCTTTNDNLPALGFWQALDFQLIKLRPGAVNLARRLKPAIPSHGHRGLPIRDELDLEFVLGETAP